MRVCHLRRLRTFFSSDTVVPLCFCEGATIASSNHPVSFPQDVNGFSGHNPCVTGEAGYLHIGEITDNTCPWGRLFVFTGRHDTGRPLAAPVQHLPATNDPFVCAIPAGGVRRQGTHPGVRHRISGRSRLTGNCPSLRRHSGSWMPRVL